MVSDRSLFNVAGVAIVRGPINTFSFLCLIVANDF